ncbi:hypothetical protein [Pseudogemmobacter sonorensis]|uniref:hypothetical protein n=1 Tax=Pseudogemmobacter sonorensis TaxID=2989681 RepID=UPI003686D011
MTLTQPGLARPTCCRGAPGWQALRGSAPEPSLAALMRARPDARSLDADAETLALFLPLFERASASTIGPHALINQRGGYGPAQLAGRPPRGHGGRICLRLAAGQGETLVGTGAVPALRQPAALHLFDVAGELVHRAELAAPEDLAVLEAVTAQLGPRMAPLTAPLPEVPRRVPVPSLPAIRQARAGWWKTAPHQHLDALMADGGPRRAHCLPHLGGGAARRVDPRGLRAFAGHLARMALPFSRAVPRPGCLQTHAGPVELLSPEGTLLLLHSGPSLMALELSAVAACWRTRWADGGGCRTMLELYDAGGMCLALLGPDTAGCTAGRRAWERLAETLPG